MAAKPVEIAFSQLTDGSTDLSNLIQQGFGPDGLGIVTVSGVPGFERMRERLLPLAAELAALPDGDKAQLEHAASNYNVGWSHGKEALEGGRLDSMKGSFYANPCRDAYGDRSASDVEQYSEYFTDNIWPRQSIPELEPALKDLGRLMVSVGLLLADRCTDYVDQQLSGYGAPAAADAAAAGARGEGDQGPKRRAAAAAGFGAALRGSACHRARLLHYFPPVEEQGAAGGGGEDAWCSWHFDHGSLTALTSAMYLKGGRPVPNPDPEGGLYIRDRAGRVAQAAIPPGHIGFQMGQAMAIQSGGLLHATPHYVRAARPSLCSGVSRNTFAVFLQPDVTFEMRSPFEAVSRGALAAAEATEDRRAGRRAAGAAAAAGGGGVAPLGCSCSAPARLLTAQESMHWKDGLTFGAFASAVMDAYYDTARRQEKEREREEERGEPPAAERRVVVLHVEAE